MVTQLHLSMRESYTTKRCFSFRGSYKADIRTFNKITNISLVSFCATYTNSADQDQAPQSAASDQGLHRMFTGLQAYRMFYQNLNKNEKHHPTTLKTEMDWSNFLEWENSIWLKWVKSL